MGKREGGFSNFTYLVVGLFFGVMSLVRDINYFYKEGSPIFFSPPFLIKIRWVPWTISFTILVIVGIVCGRVPKAISEDSKITHAFHPLVENIVKYILYAVVIIVIIAFFIGLYFSLKGIAFPK